jgi:hypothetical protein
MITFDNSGLAYTGAARYKRKVALFARLPKGWLGDHGPTIHFLNNDAILYIILLSMIHFRNRSVIGAIQTPEPTDFLWN